MKPGKNSARIRLKFIARATLLVWVVMPLLPSFGLAQPSTPPKRALVLYWYNKDFPFNAAFDRSFQEALQAAPAETVEYYPEYLETDRFPGENQSQLLHDYLQRKYADRTIDVVVASGYVTLEFLLKYRADLFPRTPIVFLLTTRPTTEQLAAEPGLTGIITLNTYRKTLDLVLRLHPGTEQVFVISGTLERDKKLETMAREQLQGYEGKIGITYLTDFPSDELIAKTKTLPERSIVLYVWQQAQTGQGKILEFVDGLALIARSASVPIYGMASWHVGSGIVGGYVNTPEASATRIAEIALRIANGERAQDIPVESDLTVPMFDWRQLQRWGISEDKLPPNSIVRFKDMTFWQQYKWHVIGVLSLCVVQALLIVALLVQRARGAHAEQARRLSEEKFSKAFRSSPDAFVLVRRSDGAIMEVNDRWQALLGYHRDEATGCSLIDLGVYVNPQQYREFFKLIEEVGVVRDFEADLQGKSGDVHRVTLSAESITINDEACILLIILDITERMKSERALRELTGRLIHLQDEERRRIAAELHDGLGQSLAIIRNRATICGRDTSDAQRVSEQLAEISSTAASAIDEVREIAHNLRPYELDRLGLAEAVESMIGKVSEATSLRLSADLDRIDGLLSPAAETSIYRIVQEGLNNVVKHAEATEARILIKTTGREVLVSVEDNGRGIRARAEEKSGRDDSGFGLAGMAERVRMLGGTYTIDSEPGRGTTLTVRLELPEQSHEQKAAHSHR